MDMRRRGEQCAAKKEKLEFCLAAAGKAKGLIPNKEERDLAERALARSRKWMDGGDDVSEELYDYLDNEENGLTLFQERETDAAVIDAWNVIIDAVAYVCKSAYLEAGAEYLPEPVESVDEDTIGHMISSFMSISEDDMEVGIRGEKVIRLWTAAGCREMNKAHHIQEYLPDAWAIGDDEGGFAIICVKDETKPGIYAVSFSSLEDSEKIFAAPSPMSLS